MESVKFLQLQVKDFASDISKSCKRGHGGRGQHVATAISDMHPLKEQYDKDGFVVVPGLITDDKLPALKSACDDVINLTRSGNWPHRRTVGRQFPPFDKEGQLDYWGVQHIMHPDLAPSSRPFAEWYTSDALVAAAQVLLDCTEDELQMEIFNLLINPVSHDFALRWHRDDVRENASEDEEREALAKWHHGIQWNAAIYEDACLFVVPGSHKKPRTPTQRAQSNTLEPPKDPLDMPDAIRVTLKPGETVFYNNNILHCAAYSSASPRATMHGCMGDIRGCNARARNILQHGLEWMESDDGRFQTYLNERGKKMLQRLIDMKRGAGNVGYSLDN